MKYNLSDYEATYRTFHWANARKFLFWPNSSKINMGEIAIDKWAETERKEKTALYWINDKGDSKNYTFKELKELSNQFAHFLHNKGVKPFDRVFFFLPRVPELYYGFLGTLKLGATVGTFFAAFGGQAIAERLVKAEAKVLVTNQLLYERIKPYKNLLKKVIIIILEEDFEVLLSKYSPIYKVRKMNLNDPALMMFTSATGKTPVCGIVIPQSAIIQQVLSSSWVLDLQLKDIYWCTGDPGWITGVAYGILSPWALGVSQVIYSGSFDHNQWLGIMQKFRVSVLYTVPTALRMLQAKLASQRKARLSNLRLIASVGEALTPSSIKWGQSFFGLTIQDTWWQTETGAMMIANFPCLAVKPGSMGKPIPGIEATILDEKGRTLKTEETGKLAFKPPWPSMMSKIWRRPDLYAHYFKKGLACHERGAKRRVEWYISGDLANKDKDGYFWFVGRADEVIKTSGERVGPSEVESALDSHPAVAEAAVIGKPDYLRGQIIKAFIVLKPGIKPNSALKKEIQLFVKRELAGHAYPREIDFVKHLPRTKSGKILHRLLKAQELGLPMGDLSSLEGH